MKEGRVVRRVLSLLSVLILCGLRAHASDLDRAVQEIQAREYELTWTSEAGTWQAPNRAHHLRTYFTEHGIRVVPRLEPTPAWEWGLSLVRYGREGAKLETRSHSPALTARSNQLDRNWGAITEWYVNDARGLEHGFTLAERPEGQGEVHLDLALAGTLSPSFAADGQAIDFRAPGGMSVLRYAKLEVIDARGSKLSARMEGLFENGTRGIRIVYDDRGAAYPVTVDPVATTAFWSNEANQAVANFGVSVATAGDVNGDGYSDILIGADKYDNGQTDEGRAFLYEGSPAGMSTGLPNWLAEGEQAGAQFGGCVAPAGDVNGDGYADVLVGARSYDNGQTDEGRVYLYLGSPDGLSFDPAWTAESDQVGALFGTSVAPAGDVNGDGYDDVIVGAPTYDNGQTDEGRAFVYLGSASGLASSPSWTTESNQASALYGVSVASAGDQNADGFDDVLVGARNYDSGQTDEGRVYVYIGSAAGLFTVANATFESEQAGANFGRSVAPAGDVNGDGYADFVVGAYTYDNGQTDEGRVYVYRGAANVASLMTTLEVDQANAQFGISVATAGDVNGDGYADVLVGAYLFDNTQTDEGVACLFLGSAAGLQPVSLWTVESDQASAQLGWSVATAGDVNGDGFSDILVGANLYDNGQADEGRAFLYLGGASVPSYAASWAFEPNRDGAGLGRAVAAAGDVNGDGYADVIVGSELDNELGLTLGHAYVFHGAATGPSAAPAWNVYGDIVGSFGNSVARAGDVNGDGYDDVIVGNYGRNSQAGRASVYLGSPTGLPTTPAWFKNGTTGEQLGWSVAGAGDVNGDGYADVIVGAPRVFNGTDFAGRAYLYLGSSTGLAATPAWSATGTGANAGFGQAVASAGDVNGDGYGDVVVGAPGADAATAGGRAYLYLGSASGLAAAPVWTSAEANAPNAKFGSALAAADFNGDGRTDLVVGAWNKLNPAGFRGRVYVYRGTGSGVVATASAILDGDGTTNDFGFSLSSAGDVNVDGFGDVIVGGPTAGTGGRGRAWLYHGSAAGPSLTAAWVQVPLQFGLTFGYAVAGAGDVNGDGFGDLVVGASNYSNVQGGEGQALLFLGNNGGGVERGLRQLRTDAVTTIALNGNAESTDTFVMRSLGRSAAGRARVRLQYNAEQVGMGLDGPGVHHGTLEDTGPAGSAAAHDTQVQVFMPTPGAPVYWRARYASDSPFFPWTPWFSPAGNNVSEGDLRMRACLDADGDGYGTSGGANCPAGPQLDCNDANAAAHPGGTEVCDGADNDCDGGSDNVPAPAGTPSLSVAKSGGSLLLTWPAVLGATSYDVHLGSLDVLRLSGGDFSGSVEGCFGNDVTGTSKTSPDFGIDMFFLLRANAGTCAPGTYDDGAASQSGSRDGELAGTCP